MKTKIENQLDSIQSRIESLRQSLAIIRGMSMKASRESQWRDVARLTMEAAEINRQISNLEAQAI